MERFEVDKLYWVKPRDEVYPVLDQEGRDTGEEETLTGEPMTVRVLGFPQERPGFVWVHNLDKNINHLYHPSWADQVEALE